MNNVNTISSNGEEIIEDFFKRMGQYFLDAGICYCDNRKSLHSEQNHVKGWVPDIKELKYYLYK